MENPNYPFFKLTLDERFPRLLITRQPEKKQENEAIYGAFLPAGMTRRMLDLLQRIFRLRPCELDIRGDFESPCPEYYLHRCLAPCVASVCRRENYLETVEIVHFILSNQFEIALKRIDAKIATLAENLEFEAAAEWRDWRAIVEEISENAKWQIAVSTMNDVINFDENGHLQITTLRRGKSVGKLFFRVEENFEKKAVLTKFIESFYQTYSPKQIFVPFDFAERKTLEKELTERFGRKIAIISKPANALPPSINKTNKLAAHQFDYRKSDLITEKHVLLEEVKSLFKMRRVPRRIESFDVAHLAGREIIASRVVAVDGVLQRDDGLVWEFENLSEAAAIAEAVRERLKLLPAKKDLPDLLIIDGGRAQLNAVKKVLQEFNQKNITVIGAVKPPKAHHQIRYFLTTKNAEIEFEKSSKAMNFIQSLRDAAHTLANETHRDLHALVQIFKNNDHAPHIQYLRVPTRYAERGGNAADLSPIRSLTQAGELILKSKPTTRKTEK